MAYLVCLLRFNWYIDVWSYKQIKKTRFPVLYYVYFSLLKATDLPSRYFILICDILSSYDNILFINVKGFHRVICVRLKEYWLQLKHFTFWALSRWLKSRIRYSVSNCKFNQFISLSLSLSLSLSTNCFCFKTTISFAYRILSTAF